MSASIVRAKHVITGVKDRHEWNQIDDGAVLVEYGRVRAIGPFSEIQAAHPDLPVHGTGRQILLPGFVNGHHHIGLTPVQLGSPDMPLELWFITRLVCRAVDLYLDTLYSAFEMIASGVTTVQHIHGWIPGKLDTVTAGANEVLRAYDDIGMRVSYSFALRDQNRLVYMDDAEFVASPARRPPPAHGEPLCPLRHGPRRLHGHVRDAAFSAPQSRTHRHPARPGEPPLVL